MFSLISHLLKWNSTVAGKYSELQQIYFTLLFSLLQICPCIVTGTLLACATVVSFTLLPSDDVCVFRDVGFHISINLLYAPLLVKTLRTYRIFAAAKSSIRMPACVSAPSQMILTVALVTMQVIRLFDWPRGKHQRICPSPIFTRLPCHSEKIGNVLVVYTYVFFT